MTLRRHERAVVMLCAAVLLLVTGTLAGKALYPYGPRGGYYEGVCSERPIAGVELNLLCVCAECEVAESDEVQPGRLHLAFMAPRRMNDLDITITGPGNYLLDRVDQEFEPGFNVFTWRTHVIEGLGIAPEELQPLVSVVGGMNIPCVVRRSKPSKMPSVSAFRVLLESSVEGNMSYCVMDSGEVVREGAVDVAANVPAEVRLPAAMTAEHVDLITVLEYETNTGSRTARRCFPIQDVRLRVESAGAQGG